MTEEKQTVVAEAIESNKAKGLNVYYISTNEHPCQVILTPDYYEHDDYPVVVTAPPADIKNGKYNWSTLKWVETDGSEVAARLIQTEASVKTLTTQVGQLSEASTADKAKNDKLNQALDTISKQQMQTSMMLGQLMQKLATPSSVPAQGATEAKNEEQTQA
ncbi:hypothetical protein [Lactobacillus iners]|nr:hypothetical protein [Lactobacillus iners]MCT7685999.1 hypothetical protein [Lactobacillus iners]MCT7752997.1 hypothetical protein [Lactobacillus iners]MCT7835318.1 hypothetical protein [Lactobacillus iners]MCT7837237.1 hypothetical protein [Lactobacillus iners]MDK7306154.1 hypothetical protein [Lactobacillus iners]